MHGHPSNKDTFTGLRVAGSEGLIPLYSGDLLLWINEIDRGRLLWVNDDALKFAPFVAMEDVIKRVLIY